MKALLVFIAASAIFLLISLFVCTRELYVVASPGEVYVELNGYVIEVNRPRHMVSSYRRCVERERNADAVRLADTQGK